MVLLMELKMSAINVMTAFAAGCNGSNHVNYSSTLEIALSASSGGRPGRAERSALILV